jgi:RNA polymerase sigma-70 factor (ECF subfamily)
VDHAEAPTDAALLEALRRGDDAALGALLERHAPAVLRFSTRMCRDPEDARDVLQETLLAAARGLREFRGGASLSTWLYTVARSFCIKKRRTSKFAPSSTVSLDDDGGDGGDGGAHLPDEARRPDEAVADRQLGDALEQAIRALEPAYREVLVLRDVEGLSAPEVAEVLGLGVDAVKSRLHRARVAVRAQLEPWWPSAEAPAAGGCRDIATLFSRYLEGEIGAAECASMQRHVAGCERCSAGCDSLKRTLTLCRARGGGDVPVEMQAQLRDAIREAVKRAPASPPAR